jgi:uncharacterized protein YjbJ (UPF0337 family)
LPLSSRSPALIGWRNGRADTKGVIEMKWKDIEDHWPQLRQRARRHWFHLTQNDVEEISGTREELIACVQERYDFSREEAQKEVDAWAFFLNLHPEPV